MSREGKDFSQKPLIVFWETTKSCDLSCKHCRASAIKESLPGELNFEQSLSFIRSLTSFGKPYPRLIITGGDPLKKRYLFEILEECRTQGISVSITPAATERLDEAMIDRLTDVGVRSYALSLDGATSDSHDSLRGVPGTFHRTIEIMDTIINKGLSVQINTAVMKSNVSELPWILNLLSSRKIKTWAPFFLIRTGRGNELEDLEPEEYEDVNNWLYFASKYGIRIRSVESPIFRRIVIERESGKEYLGGPLYQSLKEDTIKLMRDPGKRSMSYFVGSRDGSGVIFVSHDGYVSPSGFLPVQLENVKSKDIADIYRDDYLLKAIRQPETFHGKCSQCEYNRICGGSRARAYYHSGDMMASDPSCVYMPTSISGIQA